MRSILVVEDELLLRMNVVDMFEDAGFEVLEAGSADEALLLLEQHGHEVWALFTDIHMPGSMDGLALARTVHERWPYILPFVTSGRARLRDAEIPDSGQFISKPYRLSEVAEIVQQALTKCPATTALVRANLHSDVA